MGGLRMVRYRSSEVRSGDSCLAGYWACAASHVIAIGLAVAVWCDCHAVVRFGQWSRDARRRPLLGSLSTHSRRAQRTYVRGFAALWSGSLVCVVLPLWAWLIFESLRFNTIGPMDP